MSAVPSHNTRTRVSERFSGGGPGCAQVLPGSPAMSDFHHTGAFVVQFRASTDFDRGIVEGRVEHVASGRIAHFKTIQELVETFARYSSPVDTDCDTPR